jgi:hypothetical protein
VYIPPSKIVSGGQTGVDRGALDAALATSFPCGGWCPAGRKAEDGPIPDWYPLIELAGADYLERTKQNVIDSDGTLVIYFGELAGGTRETVRFCERLGKAVLMRDGAKKVPSSIAVDAMSFAALHNIAVLNVAGPRESIHPGAQVFAAKVVTWIIESKREYEMLPRSLSIVLRH